MQFIRFTDLWWNSYRSCMLPKMMCSLLTIPGGISSTPLLISHRYVWNTNTHTLSYGIFSQQCDNRLILLHFQRQIPYFSPEENERKRKHMYYFRNMITCVFQSMHECPNSCGALFLDKKMVHVNMVSVLMTLNLFMRSNISYSWINGIVLRLYCSEYIYSTGLLWSVQVDIGVPHPLNIGPYRENRDNSTYIHTLPQVSHICLLSLNELGHYKPEKREVTEQCTRDLLSTFIRKHNTSGRGFILV